MTEQNLLDVTVLEPRQKHPTIFNRFDALTQGEVLTVLNDHDPKPLYYQLLAERGDVFRWEYLEQGPEWWKVRITRSGQAGETLGQLAAKDGRKAEVFKKYGLDFCCGGKKTVREACAEQGLDAAKIEQELQETVRQKDTHPIPYDDWSPAFLADYIVNTHHRYIRKHLPEIRAYADKVLRVHGGRHPELETIRRLVENIHDELTPHLETEERILFPYIQSLWAVAEGRLPEAGVDMAVLNPIRRMETEHQTVGEYLSTLRTLTNDYAPPADACASYTLLYRMLEAFEEDLHLHVHLENNILFPKTLELENRLSL
ncbi:MAG TPA: iron-sulfur cluster repair di-iron protein [Puia sp.]|nr:iron-sulfur cluster repair di-iron protein [Puia sp.]